MAMEHLETYDRAAREAALHLYPTDPVRTEEWMLRTIGPAQFEWDLEAAFRGFIQPMSRFMENHKTLHIGSLCAALTDRFQSDLSGMEDLYKTAENIHCSAVLLENLILKNGKPVRSVVSELHDGELEGQITAQLLTSCANIYLRQLSDRYDDTVVTELYRINRLESMRMLYFLSMQLELSGECARKPTLKDAIAFARYGTVGGALRQSLLFACILLGAEEERVNEAEKAADEYGVALSLYDSIRRFHVSSSRPFEEFETGKLSHVTLFAGELWKLPVRDLPKLNGGFTLKEIMTEPLTRALREMEEIRDRISGIVGDGPLRILDDYMARMILSAREILEALPDHA